MGQSSSTETEQNVSPERLSTLVAERFAEQCLTPLELAHFKDNFRRNSTTHDEVEFWRDETIWTFLILPTDLQTGPILIQLFNYLGAWPFPHLAPAIPTRAAICKVIILLTGRYKKVLKGDKDDIRKLIFRALAIYDRRMSTVDDEHVTSREDVSSSLQRIPSKPLDDPEPDHLTQSALEWLDVHLTETDRDELALRPAAGALIPWEHFKHFIMLCLTVLPLIVEENAKAFLQTFSDEHVQAVKVAADAIVWSLNPTAHAGLDLNTFLSSMESSFPCLLDGLRPLFEVFLFSEHLELDKHADTGDTGASAPSTVPLSPKEGELMNLSSLTQISTFLPGSALFRSVRPLYLGSRDGFSIGSFEQKVLNWRAPTIFLVAGSLIAGDQATRRERAYLETLPAQRFPNSSRGNVKDKRVLYGIYLTAQWKETHKEAISDSNAILFQLSPLHDTFEASTLNSSQLTLTRSGISFGCPLSPISKAHTGSATHSVLGPVSLSLDSSLEFATFTHDAAGGGAFKTSVHDRGNFQDRFEIDGLEVWGCGGVEEAKKQMEAWAWEEREAEARRRINLGTADKDADYSLLEMAGLVGGANRSGGSMA